MIFSVYEVDATKKLDEREETKKQPTLSYKFDKAPAKLMSNS